MRTTRRPSKPNTALTGGSAECERNFTDWKRRVLEMLSVSAGYRPLTLLSTIHRTGDDASPWSSVLSISLSPLTSDTRIILKMGSAGEPRSCRGRGAFRLRLSGQWRRLRACTRSGSFHWTARVGWLVSCPPFKGDFLKISRKSVVSVHPWPSLMSPGEQAGSPMQTRQSKGRSRKRG